MTKEIEKPNTPEEQELLEKQADLASLESILAQKELDLATLTAELQAFESRYIRIVGIKFLELDHINAEIAEFLAAQHPHDQDAQKNAEAARAKADETAFETGDIPLREKFERFRPTEELQSLYRRIAKKVHPDLAIDPKDRERRTKIMSEVNQAYEEGDVERLKAILQEWETSPEAIEGEDIGARLVRTIRMIACIRRRIAEIEKNLNQLMHSDLYDLMMKVSQAADEGRDLLVEMVDKIDQEIKLARSNLNNLRSNIS